MWSFRCGKRSNGLKSERADRLSCGPPLHGRRRAPANPQQNRTRGLVSWLFPPVAQAAVKPVPKYIEDDLGRASGSMVHWDLNSHVCKDVLPLAERDLKLRQEVPVLLCAIDQISIRQKLDHRCPDAPESLVLCERLPHSRPPEHRLWRLIGMGRQLRAELRLKEAQGAGLRRQPLSERSKGFECRHSAA